MPRVLHLSHTSLVSGAEHSLLALLRAMPEAECCGLACPEGDLAHRARMAGIRVYPIPELGVGRRLSGSEVGVAVLGLARAVWAVRLAARSSRATVVHANSTRAALVAITGRTALRGPPVVTHVRDAITDSHAGLTVNRIARCGSRAIVAPSRFVARTFGAGNARGAPVSVIDNPVELNRFSRPPSRLGFGIRDGEDGHVVGIVGQITSWKGHDTAIRAMALLPSSLAATRLDIIGAVKFVESATTLDNRAFRRQLDAEIAALGLHDRVRFLGETDDVPAVLFGLDVLLVPSVAEPFGRTVAEAMVARTPVIATAVGGPAELIDDGRTGLLVPPGQPALWARAIAAVLADGQRTAAMVQAAHSVAVERFDARRHAERMRSIFISASR